MVRITPISPVILNDVKQLDAVINSVSLDNREQKGEISLSEIPIFNRDSDFIERPGNRAYAVGYPFRCGGSTSSWKADHFKTAVRSVLKRSLEYSKSRESHVNNGCGARLILINNNLLVDPAELPKSFFVTYVMKLNAITDKYGKSGIAHGMFEYSGRGENLPVKLYDTKGQLICNGSYSLTLVQAVFNTGSFQMKCFNKQVNFTGALTTEKIVLKHKKGKLRIAIGKGQLPDGSTIKLFTGISIDYLAYYKDLLSD